MGYWEQKIAQMLRIVFFSLLFTTIVKCKNEVTLPYYNTPDFTPIFLNKHEAKKLIYHSISDFEFDSDKDIKISKKTLNNKVHVASFIFTQCTNICPVMINNLKALEKKYKNSDDFAILSFSVTPWIDSVQKLKSFVKDNEIKMKNWFFLTGEKSKIYKLARKSYFAEEILGFTKDSTDFLHTEHVLLVDKNFKIRGIYNTTLSLEIKNLSADIDILLKNK